LNIILNARDIVVEWQSTHETRVPNSQNSRDWMD